MRSLTMHAAIITIRTSHLCNAGATAVRGVYTQLPAENEKRTTHNYEARCVDLLRARGKS